jgi:hypothetical protein
MSGGSVGGVYQGRLAVGILQPCVGARSDEQPHDLMVAEGGGVHQGRRALLKVGLRKQSGREGGCERWGSEVRVQGGRLPRCAGAWHRAPAR